MTGPSGACLLAAVRFDRADWTAAVEVDVQPYRDDPSTPRVEVTARQQQILDYIGHYLDRHGYPPSLREIGRAVGLKSPKSVHYQVGQLAAKGFLDLPNEPRRPRSLRLIKGGAA